MRAIVVCKALKRMHVQNAVGFENGLGVCDYQNIATWLADTTGDALFRSKRLLVTSSAAHCQRPLRLLP